MNNGSTKAHKQPETQPRLQRLKMDARHPLVYLTGRQIVINKAEQSWASTRIPQKNTEGPFTGRRMKKKAHFQKGSGKKKKCIHEAG